MEVHVGAGSGVVLSVSSIRHELPKIHREDLDSFASHQASIHRNAQNHRISVALLDRRVSELDSAAHQALIHQKAPKPCSSSCAAHQACIRQTARNSSSTAHPASSHQSSKSFAEVRKPVLYALIHQSSRNRAEQRDLGLFASVHLNVLLRHSELHSSPQCHDRDPQEVRISP